MVFEANKMHLSPTALFTSKANWAFLTILCYIVFFYDLNLTISSLGRPIPAEFKRRHLSTSFVCKQFKFHSLFYKLLNKQ